MYAGRCRKKSYVLDFI